MDPVEAQLEIFRVVILSFFNHIPDTCSADNAKQAQLGHFLVKEKRPTLDAQMTTRSTHPSKLCPPVRQRSSLSGRIANRARNRSGSAHRSEARELHSHNRCYGFNDYNCCDRHHVASPHESDARPETLPARRFCSLQLLICQASGRVRSRAEWQMFSSLVVG